MWIQTGVTIWKCPIWVKIDDFASWWIVILLCHMRWRTQAISAFPAFKEFEQGSTLSSQLFGLLSQCYLGSFQHSTECRVRTVTLLGAILRQIVPLRAPALRKATSPAMPAGKANGPGANGNTPAHTAPGLMQVCDLLEKSTKRTRSREVNNATNLWRQTLTRAVAVTTGNDRRPEIVRLKKPSKMVDAVPMLTWRAWAPWSLTWLTASFHAMSRRLVMLRLRRLVKKRDRSPSPDTDSDQDSEEHSRSEGKYSSSEDSDSDLEDEPLPKGRSRRRDRHDARAPTRRRRRSLTPRKHGGTHVNSEGDSSENESDPFAALNQFATQSTSAQPLDNGDKYAQAIGDIEKFFDSGDKTGDSVNEKFAGIFDNGLRRAPNDKLLLEYIDKYPRPQNISKLALPKTNDCIWEAMKRGPQVTDASVQKVQTKLSKALVPIINMVDDIGSGKGTTKPVADYLDQLTDAFRLGSAAFSLLNQARRDIIRNDLGYPTSKICNWKFKVGDTELFEGDVTKKNLRNWRSKIGSSAHRLRIAPVTAGASHLDGVIRAVTPIAWDESSIETSSLVAVAKSSTASRNAGINVTVSMWVMITMIFFRKAYGAIWQILLKIFKEASLLTAMRIGWKSHLINGFLKLSEGMKYNSLIFHNNKIFRHRWDLPNLSSKL